MRPIRKLTCNLTITFASVAVAVFIASVQALGLIGGGLALHGPFWQAIKYLSNNYGTIGCGIVAFFTASWLASVVLCKMRDFDRRAASI